MTIYLYCLTEPGCEPPTDVRGIAGEPVRVVDVTVRLAAWVSDLPEEAGPATTEQAVAHDRVVRAALARQTPLPARFGQSFASDSALRRALEERAELLERSLERLRGAVEMTVRILLVEAAKSGTVGGEGGGEGHYRRSGAAPALSAPATGPPEGARGLGEGRANEAEASTGAGRAYLARLRERQRASAERQRQAEFLQARVARAVDGLAREEVCSSVMPGAHSFSISHLVSRDAVAQYRLAVDSLVQADPTLRLLVSGPWAPYSFARIADE